MLISSFMWDTSAIITQIYVHCNNYMNSVQDAIFRLQNCISDVSSWMSKNTLKINEDKTE